ncbi:hypothetical protein NKR23_g2358 [Pleurostoma richardsiae]|uniref:TMEM205-like domain-containing protein n=1 Tax=Pleurostoma richardsiae TaxID=41990 RepID=A0AA38RQN6_9PEZI|nr:hypothetical protein NKR23_g2358 [Pleurostoma richardsiae]
MAEGSSNLLLSGAPYHILAYGTLLGMSGFQSFVGGTVAFKVLPRMQFSTLQTHIFPIYFSLQTALPAILAVTLPASKSLLGPAGGISGLLDPANRWGTLVPIATMFVTGLANLAVLLPASKTVIDERRAQEKKDGKRSWDPPPHSQEMTALNKKFGMLHGISSLLNLVTFAASIVYGFTLSSRIQ